MTDPNDPPKLSKFIANLSVNDTININGGSENLEVNNIRPNANGGEKTIFSLTDRKMEIFEIHLDKQLKDDPILVLPTGDTEPVDSITPLGETILYDPSDEIANGDHEIPMQELNQGMHYTKPTPVDLPGDTDSLKSIGDCPICGGSIIQVNSLGICSDCHEFTDIEKLPGSSQQQASNDDVGTNCKKLTDYEKPECDKGD